ncbi:transglycosylase SLT domain-containing protein [Undibacterium arcticum]|uniref:Transglycosylase SLT domain-containing protein n=1 Tax=Undibacterium arcticum TaxID=1762892 RepID=A0ABV7F1Y9_9BURK
MFPKKWIASLLVAGIPALMVLPQAQAQKPDASFFANDDDVFMALRDAARRDDADKTAELAGRLPDYAIPSYIDYYRLKPRIKTASEDEIRQFLTRYAGSAIADRLRNDWLLELGRQRDWAGFDEQYPLFALNDDTQLKCYALMSKAVQGRTVDADARALLVAPKDYGDGCIALITLLTQNGQFKADDVWAQVRLAVEINAPGVARRIAANTDATDRQLSQALDFSAITVARGLGAGRTAHEIYLLALGRVARNSPPQAADALSSVADRLTAQEQAQGWAQIALQASYNLAPEARDYWRRAQGATLSLHGYQWRVRNALRAGDWKLVQGGIDAMPEGLRQDPAWVYWHGRALQQDRTSAASQELAQQQFTSIADQTNFYGQLALEELGQQITVPNAPLPLTADEIAPMATNTGFQRALKFFAMNLRFEGTREWNWELRGMSEREHLAAAEFARQNNVLDRMVSTSERTKTEVDFSQRFPTPHRDIMQEMTQKLGLDMAWVYGLIRQESRFINNARSQVGASGLMQIMPATASYVAKKIGFGDYSRDRVNEINTNILLGTNYLSMVLDDLDGSQALATAAYNAGPGRSRAWRASLSGPVEGAIFAETIPFAETRGYVKNVLSNATYYAALFEHQPQSLKARLGTVTPKGFVASELP